MGNMLPTFESIYVSGIRVFYRYKVMNTPINVYRPLFCSTKYEGWK